MESIWFALIGGMLAFPHCLGMCGGFALHLTAGGGRATVLGRQLLWHLGRITTYVFLGTLAGYLGRMISLARWPAVKDIPGYFAGALMIVMGLYVLGLFPTRAASAPQGKPGLLSSFFGQLLGKPSSLSALSLGLANGFLPCPITLGFLALAAGSTSVLGGMCIMAAMGVGTIWALLTVGLAGHFLRQKWKRWGAVLTGILLVLMGSWTVLRKAKMLPPIPGLHMPQKPLVPAPGKGCCNLFAARGSNPVTEEPSAGENHECSPESNGSNV